MKKLIGQIRDLFLVAYQKAQPVLGVIKSYFQRAREYYRTHPKAKKWSIIASIVLGPLLILLIVVWIEIPSKRELRNIQNQVASEVYSADSVLLGRYYIQDRTEIKYNEISPVVINALIATEDIRFYDHDGVDYESLGRVLIKSIFMQDESSGGGSTITQQLAKNLYPRRRYWIFSMPMNKAREVITAFRLEDIYSKEDLITMYLNTIPFADLTFGIEAAAKRFYSTTAKELNANQAAILVGMLKATTSYNPRLYPERARTRRNVVLSQMAKYNFLTKEVSDSIKLLPIDLQYNSVSYHQGLAPYFREYVKSELIEWCKTNFKPNGDPYNIYTDGLKIYTTVDSKLQTYAEKAVAEQMTIVQKSFFDHWGKEDPWKGKDEVVHDAVRHSPRYEKLKEQGLTEDQIMEVFNKKVAMRLFTWKGEQDTNMSPLDSIKHTLKYLSAGFLAMEPSTGRVRAWVGGIEHDFFQFDHVKTSTKRQVGSIFKPIVYAEAIEKGIEPCELISAGRETYIDDEGEKWTPRNSQNDYEVEYTMPGALAYSVNTVAVKLIIEAGVKNTVDLARSMGIVSEFKNVPSVALGSTSISLMEMTTAYSCFANYGITTKPYFISAIHDLDDHVFTNFKSEEKPKRVISEESAKLVLQMMKTVVHEGTASRLRWQYGVYNDVAGKTGTTQSNADGWFMAVTPGLVVGTWVGADDPRIHFRSTELGQGGTTALPMYAYFMKQVNEDDKFKKLSKEEFPRLSNDLQERLNCDLYELNDDLRLLAQQTLLQRDSLIQADTSAKPREDSFLEKLYKRKLKKELWQQKRDSIAIQELEHIE
ncbi:MAG: transglycosylase domain-containing protein [Chryseolinea sp.]